MFLFAEWFHDGYTLRRQLKGFPLKVPAKFNSSKGKKIDNIFGHIVRKKHVLFVYFSFAHEQTAVSSFEASSIQVFH